MLESWSLGLFATTATWAKLAHFQGTLQDGFRQWDSVLDVHSTQFLGFFFTDSLVSAECCRPVWNLELGLR